MAEKMICTYLTSKTDQEVFDIVAKHLLKQNKKCESDSHACRYRYGDLKCAAGCLIPDVEYKAFIERKSWRSLVLEGVVPSAHRGLISQLQITHDCVPVNRWLEALARLARSEHLSTVVLGAAV